MKSWVRSMRERGQGWFVALLFAFILIGVSLVTFSFNALVESREKNDRIHQLEIVISDVVEGIDCRAQISADTAVADYQVSIEANRAQIAYFRALIAAQAGAAQVTREEVDAFAARVDRQESRVNALEDILAARADAVGICKRRASD